MIHYLIYCQGDILLTNEGNIPFGDSAPIQLKPWNHVTTISQGDEQYKICRLDTPVQGLEGYQMQHLRNTFSILSPADYQMAGKGAELVYWDQTNKYCGVCGAPNKWHTEISKHCTECGKEIWPSVATAIIVRIEKGDEILLVQARSFRSNHYGLVAGFLETGESLEQCVEREVMEETGLTIKNLRYFGSQPWPYPYGLMVGFVADYQSGDISLQKEELCKAAWFRRDNLPPIPDKASIARQLIDDWLSNHAG